jgi:DNA-binding FadR family transcriptional regulator
MGWETANVHLGTRTAHKAILRHLQKQRAKWLHAATEEMLRAVGEDWKDWKRDGFA